MRRERLYLAMVGGWVLLTFTLTSIPNPDFGPSFPGEDKIAHFLFYGVSGFLFVLWRREAGEGAARAALSAALFGLLLGAVDEFHQQWIPGRSMDLLDWAADAAGGAAGAACSSAAVKLFPFLRTGGNPPAPREVAD